jgi:hypothetical protein
MEKENFEKTKLMIPPEIYTEMLNNEEIHKKYFGGRI